jgi:ABC-type sugar transport system permease subunit
VVVVVIFLAYPIAAVIIDSAHSWDGLAPDKEFIGLANYAEAVRDPDFRNALTNTLLWGIGTVPAQILGGLALALLLSRAVKARTLWRTVFVLPAVLSPVVIAGLWRWIYSPEAGVLNSALEIISYDLTRSWLGEITWAFPSAMAVSVWRWVGINMIFYLAALQVVDHDMIEAAQVDGATPWQAIRHIVIPLLRPTTGLLVLLGAIGTFREFDTIYVLTGGGPAKSTSILSIEIFQAGFQLLRVGYASAMSVMLLTLSVVVAGALLVVIRRSTTAR